MASAPSSADAQGVMAEGVLLPRAPHDDVLMRAGRCGLYAVLVLSSLLVARVGDYTAGDIVLVLTVGVTLFAVAATCTWGRRHELPIAALLIFSTIVGGGALSGLRAQSAGSTLAVVARLVLVILVLPWIAKILLPRPELVRRALTAFAVGCGICGAGTIVQFVFGSNAIPGTAITDAGRFAGFTQNVSDTGGVCCAGVVLALALLVSADRRARVIPLLALIGSAFGLLLSGSVSGLISTVVGALVLLLTGVLRPRAALLAVLGSAAFISAVVGIQVAAGALNPLQRILQTTGNSADARYDTAGSRVSTYTEALRKIGENPVVGAGLDPNSTIVDGIYPAHNLFIAALYCGGALLLVGITIAVFRPLGTGVLRRRREPLVAIGLAVALTELVFAMTAPSLYNRYFWIPVALLLAAAALRPASAPAAPATSPSPSPNLETAWSGGVSTTVAFARAGDPSTRHPGGRHLGW